MKKVLYVFDDINYNSGAKKVTLYQMKELQKTCDIYLFSLTKPKEEIEFLDASHILDRRVWSEMEIYAVSFKTAMGSKRYSFLQKASRILYALFLRLGLGDAYFEKGVLKRIPLIMEEFDDIIVVSEASKLRRLVSKLENPKKIQWIHTDYARWSEFSGWSRAVSRHDDSIYKQFDVLVVLSNNCKKAIIEKIPSIEKKTVVISNMIDGEYILQNAQHPVPVEMKNNILNFITVARLDKEKRIDRILQIAKEMAEINVDFKWYIIGDGPLRAILEEKNKHLNLEEKVVFLGHLENPYSIMRNCNALVLLSRYEGTPVTIDEAMVLGIKVIAPEMGGISEQVKDYKFFCLIKNDKIDLDEFITLKNCEKYVLDYKEKNLRIHKLIKEIL